MGSITNIIAKEITYGNQPYCETRTNHQKFSDIVNAVGLAGCQNQAWCSTYQFALEIEEFGVAKALEHWHMTKSNYCGYSVFSTRDMFPSSKKGRTPRIGALVIFRQSHMGRVLSINYNSETFKCGEGNTSNRAYERNGDSCAIKTYSWADPKIQWFCYIDYDSSSSESTTTPSTKSYLSRGDNGSSVKEMQVLLIYIGYSCGTYGADGDFGRSTDSALKSFQKEYGLSVDGKYGNASKTKLTEVYNAKKNESSTHPVSTDLKGLRTTSALNYRVTPNGSIIGTFKQNTYVQISQKKQDSNGIWWYKTDNGWISSRFVEGWIREADGKWWYILEKYNYAINAWNLIDGLWFFFDQNGWMVSSEWIWWKGKCYYLRSSGAMATHCYVAHGSYYYWVNEDGIWESQWDTKTPNLLKYKLAE